MPANRVPFAPPEAPDLRAKPLPRRLPIVGSAPDLVPARMINEALYCERLLYLEWARASSLITRSP
jgi:CRISPR-associated protein Cas1